MFSVAVIYHSGRYCKYQLHFNSYIELAPLFSAIAH